MYWAVTEFGACAGIEVKDYKLGLYESTFFNFRVERDLEAFRKNSDVIRENLIVPDLKDIENKLFMRDIFGAN